MDVHEECDELTGDDAPISGESMGDEATYRERAAAKLDQIAQDAKEALAEHDIGISLFFLIPNSGRSILTFGTPADPSDDLWDEVRKLVSAIVEQSIGLERTRCRNVRGAMTAAAPIA